VGTRNSDFTPSLMVSEPPAFFSEASLAAIQAGSARKASKLALAASSDLWVRREDKVLPARSGGGGGVWG